VYAEGTLYPSIFLLQIGRDIMPTPRGWEVLISINFPLTNWEGYHAYSSRMGRKLCLLAGVRTLPLLRSRDKNPFVHIPCDVWRFGS